MHGQSARDRATVLYVLGIIGFLLAFIGVLDNFFLSEVLLIAALITSTALVILRALTRAEDAADAVAAVSLPPTGSSPVTVRVQ